MPAIRDRRLVLDLAYLLGNLVPTATHHDGAACQDCVGRARRLIDDLSDLGHEIVSAKYTPETAWLEPPTDTPEAPGPPPTEPPSPR
jgi:hypothetical protein